MAGRGDKYKQALLLVVLVPVWTVVAAFGAEVTVKAAVEKVEVFVGEPFLLQIRVEGNDSPDEPDLSGLTDFQVQPRGGQRNNSESVTIINGKVNRVSSHGYIFQYSLTAKRNGRLTIPAIPVVVDGRSLTTRPMTVTARKPVETADFKLRLHLSKTKCYVGEPIVLTTTWYIGKDVNGFEFAVPLLTDPRFTVVALEDDNPPQDPLTVPLGPGEIIAGKTRKRLNGREYMAVTFKQVVIPRQAGKLTLPQATVSCKALAGYQQNRRPAPFGSFFGDDFFGRSRRQVYKTVIIPSNEPVLRVASLPQAGRPSHFTGLVGAYDMVAGAAPVEVNVGDPITLTIEITGPAYVGNVSPPPLKAFADMHRDFKIPEEMAPGEVRGRVKTFTQTIRAKHAGVTEIPALPLSYFNPETGRYEEARSAPIPIRVKATRSITARDAEGSEAPVAGRKVQSFAGGIAHNYEGLSVLQSQAAPASGGQAPISWLLLLGLPPCGYLLLLVTVTILRSGQKGASGLAAKKAHSEYVRALNAVPLGPDGDGEEVCARLAQAVQGYLGKKLGLPAGAVTYYDVEEKLKEQGVSAAVLASLQNILDHCEAQRYAAGHMGRIDPAQLLDQARALGEHLERSLG